MSRLFIFLGIDAIVLAVVFLLVTIFATEHPLIAGTIESVVCNSPEKLIIERSRWSLPNGERGENIYFSCEIEPGEARSVTDSVVLLNGGIFTMLLFVGIILLTIGATRRTRQTEQGWNTQMSSYLDNFDKQYGVPSGSSVEVNTTTKNIPPEAQEMIQNMLGGIMSVATRGMANVPLSDRLQQLEDAHQKGLITQDEYQRVRQAILDSMDD